MKKQLLIIALISLTQPAIFAQTKVYLVPALHSLHKVNRQYTYDSVQAVIQRIRPNVIAVEIRPEDINTDTSYLQQNYPYEMWMMRYWFPAVQVAGFDWLGNDIAGKPIPPNYWKYTSLIKQLQRNLEADSAMKAKLNRCKNYTDDRMVILENSSLKGIYNSNDAILVKAYYDCLNLQLQNTQYDTLSQFYEKRNKMLQENIGRLVQQYPGKTIVVLTGDDHYPYIREYLQRQKVALPLPPL